MPSLPASIYEISAKTLKGSSFSFADLKGKVVLVVNVASRCGYTKQYSGLEKLYQSYKGQGLEIVGFPCNQFGKQEPGSDEDIATFCSTTYQVSFPILSKGDVNGENTHSLYSFLKSKIPGDIAWNFEKFVVDKNGNVVERFKSGKTPEELEQVIKAHL